MSQPHDSVWRDEAKTEQVKRLWADGLSANQIAAEMDCGLTKNAVIAKVHRLGLDRRSQRRAKPKPPRTQRRTPFRPISDRKVERPRIGADSRMTMAFDVPSGALTELPADESPDAVRFLKREGNKCRWPLNETVPISAHLVCGSKCDGEHSYCGRHYRMSIQPNRVRTLDLSEAERARRAAQGRKNRTAYQERLTSS